MRIYETQRIGLNNDYLILKGIFTERLENCNSQAKLREEKKKYYDFFRSKFNTNQVLAHYSNETDNFLVVFPTVSREDNIYEMNFDNGKQLFFIEITECC